MPKLNPHVHRAKPVRIEIEPTNNRVKIDEGTTRVPTRETAMLKETTQGGIVVGMMTAIQGGQGATERHLQPPLPKSCPIDLVVLGSLLDWYPTMIHRRWMMQSASELVQQRMRITHAPQNEPGARRGEAESMMPLRLAKI